MRILLLAASLFLVACNGSGGGDGLYYCYSDGPTSSNLVLSPDSAVIGEGGGNVTTNVTIDYKTRDGAKILRIDYRVEDGNGTRISDVSLNEKLKGSGSFEFDVPISTQTTDAYTVRVRFFDECFETSNWRDAAFDVIAPTALAGQAGYATTQLDGRIYFIGGSNDDGQVSDSLLQYDPVTGQLLSKAPLPEGRAFAAAAAYDGIVYVFGGWAHGFKHDSTFAYYSVTNSWTAVAPMSSPLAGAAASVSDGMIDVIGDDGLNRYDPTLNLWTKVNN